MTFYSLSHCGSCKESFDVFTKNGAFAGIIVKQKSGYFRFYTNTTATKGSKRKFQSFSDALEFLHARRVKKGWAA